MSARSPAAIPAALAFLLGLLGACAGARLPGPLERPAGAAAAAPASGGAALVRWNGGPVSVSRPGAPDGFALTAFRKEQAVGAGWGVEVGSAGRAEIAWIEHEATLVLFERGRVRLEDPAAGGSLARLVDVTSAQVRLPAGTRVLLPGGGELTSDSEQPGGPFQVADRGEGLVRVVNQGASAGRIRFLGVELVLAPLEAVDLPTAFGADEAAGPAGIGPQSSEWDLDGTTVRIFGPARASAGPAGLHVVAEGTCAVEGLGVRVSMEAGDELTLRPSAVATPAPAAAGPSQP